MTDTDLMPFGKYKGKAMQDVPVEYLHWFYHKGSIASATGEELFCYIKENLSALKLENPDLIWSR